MDTLSQRVSADTIGLEQRQTLVLRAWEAVNSERELQGVLEAITNVLSPVIRYDGIAIISFDGKNHDPYAAYIVGYPRREGETLDAYFNRPEFNIHREVPVRPLIPYPIMDTDGLREGLTYTCEDLLAKEGWYEHEFNLAAGGVCAYASILLIAREEVIGVAA